MDINYSYRNVSFTGSESKEYLDLFSQGSIDWCSFQITKRLKGVHPEGKNIKVSDDQIQNVLDSFYISTYLAPQALREMAVMHIVNYIENDFTISETNRKYSAWVQKYDLETGLKQFDNIKLNNRRGQMYFRWNY